MGHTALAGQWTLLAALFLALRPARGGRSGVTWVALLAATALIHSYLLAMEDMSLELGRMSKKFKHAEGWRRHLHFGFCKAESDPLSNALGRNCLINQHYERDLEKGF